MAIIKILGIEIDQATFQIALDHIENFIHQRGPHHIVTVNPLFLVQATRNQEFHRILNHADLAVADGAGLLWASRLLDLIHHSNKTHRLPERITGADLVPALCARAETKGWKIYLLGGEPGIAQRAAAALRQHFPDLKIVGAEAGPLLTETSQPLTKDQQPQLQATLARIRHAKPDLLLVAFGPPKQEYFIARHKHDLKTPVMMGVGGTFDFLAGRRRRAPRLLQIFWFEWLWRLIIEPRRIGRIWNSVVVFPYYFLGKQLFKNSFQSVDKNRSSE